MNAGIPEFVGELAEKLQAMCAPVVFSILLLGNLPFWQLVALAVVFRFGIERIPFKATRWIAPLGAGLAMLGYFAFCLLRDRGEFEDTFIALVRSLLVYQVVWGMLTALDGSANAFIEWCRPFREALANLAKDIRSGLAAARYRLARWRQPASPLPRPQPPLPTRAVRMQRLAQAAQEDYNAEIAALAELPLDSDEREILELEAKQRLLEKISRIAQA
jgi:hypothetical protein